MRRDTKKKQITPTIHNHKTKNQHGKKHESNKTRKNGKNEKRKNKTKGKHRKMDHTLPATVTNSENAELTYMSSSSLN